MSITLYTHVYMYNVHVRHLIALGGACYMYMKIALMMAMYDVNHHIHH